AEETVAGPPIPICKASCLPHSPSPAPVSHSGPIRSVPSQLSGRLAQRIVLEVGVAQQMLTTGPLWLGSRAASLHWVAPYSRGLSSKRSRAAAPFYGREQPT